MGTPEIFKGPRPRAFNFGRTRDSPRGAYDHSHSRHGGAGGCGGNHRSHSGLATCIPLVSAYQYRNWGGPWQEGCICGMSCVRCAMTMPRTSGRWAWG